MIDEIASTRLATFTTHTFTIRHGTAKRRKPSDIGASGYAK
jgi:hypothetical protein